MLSVPRRRVMLELAGESTVTYWKKRRRVVIKSLNLAHKVHRLLTNARLESEGHIPLIVHSLYVSCNIVQANIFS